MKPTDWKSLLLVSWNEELFPPFILFILLAAVLAQESDKHSAAFSHVCSNALNGNLRVVFMNRDD